MTPEEQLMIYKLKIEKIKQLSNHLKEKQKEGFVKIKLRLLIQYLDDILK